MAEPVFTRHERVFFSDTGAEAVTSALRMARAATGRSKVVVFRGSHRAFDGDAYVLDHGESSALDFIAAHGDSIAAVLIEPVQSLRPELQPIDFLHELRYITEHHGIALVVDELRTGFRVHPGGAQASFDVKGDMAVYGELVGGGLPVGVVAGPALPGRVRRRSAVRGGRGRRGRSRGAVGVQAPAGHGHEPRRAP